MPIGTNGNAGGLATKQSEQEIAIKTSKGFVSINFYSLAEDYESQM